MIRAVFVRLVLCLCLLITMVVGLGAFAFWDFRPQAMTIGQQVFFFQDPDEVANWMGLNAHENVHRSQYREHGFVAFLRDYILDPERRLRWEIDAHQADLCYRTLTHANPPRIAWEDEARKMARYVSASSDLPLESIERQMERELSPTFCRKLLARIGVRELPRAEFPADAVLRGLLSAEVLTDLQNRVSLHALAGPWALPTDSLTDTAAARHAWEVVSWSPFPVAEPGLWSLSGVQPKPERDAIALQMDSLQIESFQLLARSAALPWFDPEIRFEPFYPDHLGGMVVRWKARIKEARSDGRAADAEQAARELLSLGLRIHGSTLQKRGRDYSAQLVREGLHALLRLRASLGDTASVRLLRAPTGGDLETFHALSARNFLTALPATLERADVPLSVRWGLLSTGYALARCGAARDTGMEDAHAWLRVQAPKIGWWERAVVERIRRWPRNGWHCGGLADRRAMGWRRTPERPPIYVAWESRKAT